MRLKLIGAVAIVLFAMGMPSISSAQYSDQRLNNFLNNHPDVRSQLMHNPNLIYDRQFRHEHPDLQTFMQDHPNVWGKLPDSGRWGAYGPDRAWHEADWWHEHNPNWIHEHHPEWMHDHPDWGHAEIHPGPGYEHPGMGYEHPVGEPHPINGYEHPVGAPHAVVVAPSNEHHHDEYHH
jgi:hypothetical protein